MIKMAKTRKMCIDCGIRKADKNSPEARFCLECEEYAGWENAHSDENHDDDTVLADGCWICHPELDLTNNTVKTGHTNTAAKTHTSHADCKHARTPIGRAACRKAHTWNGTVWV